LIKKKKKKKKKSPKRRKISHQSFRSNKKGKERNDEEEDAYYEIEAVCSIEMLEKLHLLKMCYITVENLVYFHHIFAFYVIKKL
jgi:hypothetical protein